jgi:hypothetical protein
VTSEAIYTGLRIRPILRNQLRSAPSVEIDLTLKTFLAFYVPLVLTAFLSFFVSPLTSAAVSRMPDALSSLAVWPVISGLIFILRSPATAYNEVVVALIDEPGALPRLRRFAAYIALGATLATLLIAATPLSDLWLTQAMAIPVHLLALGRGALPLILALPLFALLQSWFQGAIVAHKHTRGVTEAVAIYLAAIGATLGIGIFSQRLTGLYVALVALEISGLLQSAWLWYRSRPAFAAAAARVRDRHAVDGERP